MNTIKADCHLHSALSGDGLAPMEDMVKKGIELGLKHMCMTEHMDYFYKDESGNLSDEFILDMNAYEKELFRLKEIYSHKITLLFGIELGLHPRVIEKNKALAHAEPFDFIIGSSHMCHDLDPYFPAFYENRTDREAYEEYFLSLLENARGFLDFDVYGHLDYVVRYGRTKNRDYHYEDYKDIFDVLLRYLIENGKGIECNTAGLNPKYQLGEVHPSREILKRYLELGGEILTIGSDAHKPEHMCYGFETAAEILRECGFRYYTVFQNRKPEFFPL